MLVESVKGRSLWKRRAVCSDYEERLQWIYNNLSNQNQPMKRNVGGDNNNKQEKIQDGGEVVRGGEGRCCLL